MILRSVVGISVGYFVCVLLTNCKLSRYVMREASKKSSCIVFFGMNSAYYDDVTLNGYRR